MPTVSLDSKSFLLQAGRAPAARFPLVAASFDASLLEPGSWSTQLAAIRHAGFNSIVIRVPWLVHEPTQGRRVFTGACDVRRAIELAGAAGLKVALRIGPCVGGGCARGGLPGWVRGVSGGRVREANAEFLACVSSFWRALAPQFVDLQATRNSNGVLRPVIAVGIEDDWRCLDEQVGGAYFSALARFAREVGIEVPLFTANNCWYMHEGVVDAWQDAADVVQTASELRQVNIDAPPMLMHAAEATARAIGESVASRADFVCEVLGTRHLHATSARGCAQRAPRELFPMRRALVFASSFGEILAGMTPDIATIGAGKQSVVVLRGADKDQVAISVGKDSFDARAENLAIAGATLEHCSGSLVALLGDIVVVAGAPRAKLAVQVDGSSASLAVPADDAAPKITKVRGLRVAVVSERMAAGAGVAADAIEFVDRAGETVARIARDGTVSRPKPAKTAKSRSSEPIALGRAVCVVEHGLLDGTHARFARVASPSTLGDLGVASMHGYYSARFTPPKAKGRDLWIDARGLARGTSAALKPRGIALQCEVRSDFLASSGMHGDDGAGIVGAIREVAPLKGVKGAIIDLPRFDATRVARFVWGYEARADEGSRKTVRWTFAARGKPVVVRVPAWWHDEGHARAGHALRLNGGLVAFGDWEGRDSVLLDGALLSPMRPKALAKGEKPPKGKAVKLEPGANELLLDLDPRFELGARELTRLLKDVELLDVCGEIDARWSFARVSPPASWATAVPAPKKPIGAPAWFRVVFSLDAPRAVELKVSHDAGSVATVLVNGEGAMVLDGASGEPEGTARKRRFERTVRVPEGAVRAGENEICIFEPDGVMPAIEVRVPTSSA